MNKSLIPKYSISAMAFMMTAFVSFPAMALTSTSITAKSLPACSTQQTDAFIAAFENKLENYLNTIGASYSDIGICSVGYSGTAQYSQ